MKIKNYSGKGFYNSANLAEWYSGVQVKINQIKNGLDLFLTQYIGSLILIELHAAETFTCSVTYFSAI